MTTTLSTSRSSTPCPPAPPACPSRSRPSPGWPPCPLAPCPGPSPSRTWWPGLCPSGSSRSSPGSGRGESSVQPGSWSPHLLPQGDCAVCGPRHLPQGGGQAPGGDQPQGHLLPGPAQWDPHSLQVKPVSWVKLEEAGS